jgi:carbonic anhydrase
MCEHCEVPRPVLSRRSVMAAAASLLAASALPLGAVRAEQPALSEPPPNAIPPAEALDRLMQGNGRYAANEPNEKDFSAGRAERVHVHIPSLLSRQIARGRAGGRHAQSA